MREVRNSQEGKTKPGGLGERRCSDLFPVVLLPPAGRAAARGPFLLRVLDAANSAEVKERRRGWECDPLRRGVRQGCFWLGAGQSTVMRVAAVVPVTSEMGLPTPMALKLGGQSLKSNLPL
jgi:hypothetical protein